MTTTTLPFPEYMTLQLAKMGGRASAVPDPLLRGFAECRICGDWQKGENLFTEIVDDKVTPGNLCGRCAGVWSFNPDDKTGGCLVPVIERAVYDPVWSKSPDAQRHPWIVNCEQKNCFYHIATESEDAGYDKLISHECPYRGGPTKEGLLIPLKMAREAWEELDDVVKTLMEGNLDADQAQRFKSKARGMAEIIAVIMPPPYDSADAVALEAKRRYTEGPSGYQTDILVTPTLDAPPEPASAASPTPNVKALGASEIAAIKNAIKSGFTAEEVAPIYGVTVNQVKSYV